MMMSYRRHTVMGFVAAHTLHYTFHNAHCAHAMLSRPTSILFSHLFFFPFFIYELFNAWMWLAAACSHLPPAVMYGAVDSCPGTASGASCSPACDPGYSPVSQYTCIKGNWTGSPSCAAGACSSAPPVVANSDPASYSSCSGTSSGSVCSIACNAGYTLSSSYTCTLGMWHGSPACHGKVAVGQD